MNSDAFKERLKQVIGTRSIRSFAEVCSISEGTLRRFLNGEGTPTLDKLDIIAGYGGVNLGWLASGEGKMRSSDDGWEDHSEEARKEASDKVPLDLNEYVHIPRYEVTASAGGGAVIHSEQIVDYLSFRADWVRNSLGISVTSLALINVKGDSMEPTLSDGDVILIDMTSNRVEDNSIYVLRFDGVLLVKRIQRKLDGSIIVRSDNTMYEPEMVSGDMLDTLNVVGRVVWCGRRM